MHNFLYAFLISSSSAGLDRFHSEDDQIRITTRVIQGELMVTVENRTPARTPARTQCNGTRTRCKRNAIAEISTLSELVGTSEFEYRAAEYEYEFNALSFLSDLYGWSISRQLRSHFGFRNWHHSARLIVLINLFHSMSQEGVARTHSD